MTRRYTFAIKWPMPFPSSWQQSARRFDTITEAGIALCDYLCLSGENGVFMEGRIEELSSEGR